MAIGNERHPAKDGEYEEGFFLGVDEHYDKGNGGVVWESLGGCINTFHYCQFKQLLKGSG